MDNEENKIDYEKIIKGCVNKAVEAALKDYKYALQDEASSIKSRKEMETQIKTLFDEHKKTFPRRSEHYVLLGPQTNGEECSLCAQKPIFSLPFFKYGPGRRACLYCFLEMLSQWYTRGTGWMDDVALDAAQLYQAGIVPLVEARKSYDKL